VPIAEIADAGAGEESVNISRALVKPLLAGPNQDERLLGRDVHPHIERPARDLTDNREFGSPFETETTVVDGAVGSKWKAQLAAQFTRYVALDDGAGAGAEANVGDNIEEANAEGVRLHGWSCSCHPIATERASESGQEASRAEPSDGLPPRDPVRHLPRQRIELHWIHGVLLS
jgi:hypothetical protein